MTRAHQRATREGSRPPPPDRLRSLPIMDLAQYIKSISNAANTILEGMAVTFSHLFREPITVQYPDKTDRPVTEMLPPRYRRFLELQRDICTGCTRCERSCPIPCIAIALV